MSIVETLRAIVGPKHVSSSAVDRLTYSGDMWPRRQILKQSASLPTDLADCVVWPENTDEVCRVLKACMESRTPVVPYGAGSGVCGGTVPPAHGVVVDMRRMDRVCRVDPVSRTVEVEAGVLGHLLEKTLQEQGFTLGHFPSSILCSTLGGWLATRSAGQLSSKYGKIEDMVLGVEVALPSGQSITTGCFGAESGVDWTQVFVGSEGTLGVITKALLKVFPAPSARLFRGFAFPDLESGFSALRHMMQEGVNPSVLRLYDPVDALVAGRHGHPPDSGREERAVQRWLRQLVRSGSADVAGSETGTGDGQQHTNLQLKGTKLERFGPLVAKAREKTLQFALANPASVNRLASLFARKSILIVGVEGGPDSVVADMATVRAISSRLGGEDLGDGPGLQWYEKRYAVSFKQSKVFGAHAFVDTMEVSTTWTHLLDLYLAVKRTLAPHVFVMAHFSHAYRDGCSIYFTFTGWRATPEQSLRAYDELWKAAMTSVQLHHGTLSHHHGIGILKRDFMEAEFPGGILVFRALKKTLDPMGIMNPGKVFRNSGLDPVSSAERGARG